MIAHGFNDDVSQQQGTQKLWTMTLCNVIHKIVIKVPHTPTLLAVTPVAAWPRGGSELSFAAVQRRPMPLRWSAPTRRRVAASLPARSSSALSHPAQPQGITHLMDLQYQRFELQFGCNLHRARHQHHPHRKPAAHPKCLKVSDKKVQPAQEHRQLPVLGLEHSMASKHDCCNFDILLRIYCHC